MLMFLLFLSRIIVSYSRSKSVSHNEECRKDTHFDRNFFLQIYDKRVILQWEFMDHLLFVDILERWLSNGSSKLPDS